MSDRNSNFTTEELNQVIHIDMEMTLKELLTICNGLEFRKKDVVRKSRRQRNGVPEHHRANDNKTIERLDKILSQLDDIIDNI